MNGFIGFLLIVYGIVVTIVFFVMASNIGKCVDLLRGISKQLKEANEQKQKAGQ